jgi:thiol-disulfide isomerase/thioredoxin
LKLALTAQLLAAGAVWAAGWDTNTVLPSLAAAGLEGTIPDIKGKVVLLDFWASWCGPCKGSFPVLDQMARDFGPRGLVVLGVSVDEKREAMERFLKQHPVAFAVVRDARQSLVQAAAITAMPTSFLVDRKGRVRFVHNGFHAGQTEEAYRREIESLLAEPAEVKP